jgi:hypothetical protein
MEAVMGTTYDTDVVAWANEQATLLREGRLTEIDVLNIAEEIEDVAKTEQRELGHRLQVLIAHLLKWKFQPSHRGKSWKATIRAQRIEIRYALSKMPSLKRAFDDEEWLNLVWMHAVALAQRETELEYPEQWIWALGEILSDDFWPD